MLKLKWLIIAALTIGMFGRCSKTPTTPDTTLPRELTSAEKSIVESDNKFGLKLFRQINTEEGAKNIFISPLSVSMALGMTLNGAHGSTYDAMRATLEYEGLTEEQINKSYHDLMELLLGLDPEVVLQIANSIWYRNTYTFRETFINTNKQYFDAEVAGLNFDDPASVNVINGWVNQSTNGKITEIIDSIHPATVMFLINAIYFKGTWTYQFEEKDTYDGYFTLPDNSQQNCKMMRQANEFNYFNDEQIQAVELPYGDGLFSMILMLPKQDVDIEALIKNLDQTAWDSWLGKLTKQNGTVHLPRFKLEYEIKMNDALTALGMGIAFSDLADFTSMYEPGGLFISQVKHKSFVEVNEEGTEASAVTIVEIRETMATDEFNLVVNRPFIFAIRENHSGSILFIGKIVNPNS
ncbi:MAG: serpin family protein [Candidatus Zhuqueibacterota bacterium]